MGIPDSVVEDVRMRADLVDLVSEHTTLRRVGRTFRGPCPLHGGEGPNFSVDPDRNLFKCFVCGEGGDVFAFPMKHLGLDFPSAVRFVAERSGMEIPEDEGPRERDPREPLFEVCAFAADWFRRNLEGDAGTEARAYLERRELPSEAVEVFGLGWAPEAWTALVEAAGGHGIDAGTLIELGLARPSRRGPGGEPYDAFRGRLVFPIRDLGGRVVAFGGRVLAGEGEGVPKYINSPDTPLFHKGEILYGLDRARGPIRKAGEVLVVEGYMDVIGLAARGVDHVVAPLGTALTPEQAALLSRYAKTAVLLYDSDEAGLKATFRSGDAVLRAGMEARVATLPPGEDPDSMARSGGSERVREVVGDAIDVVERKIQILERRGYFDSVARTRRAIDALLPTVRATADDVLREMYLSRIAERTKVPVETLREETARMRDVGAPQPRRRPVQRAAPDSPAAGTPPGPERNLLALLLRDEAYVERAARELRTEDFRDRRCRDIYEGLLHIEGGERDGEGRWLLDLPEDVRPLVEELIADPETAELSHVESYFHENVRRMLARTYQDRLMKLREDLHTMVEHEDDLLREIQEVHREARERGVEIGWGILRRGPGDAS